MNERIAKLAVQAGYKPLSPPTFADELNEIFMRKFAELIVLECTKAVMDGTKEGDHYAQRIEEHFDNGPGGIIHFGVES